MPSDALRIVAGLVDFRTGSDFSRLLTEPHTEEQAKRYYSWLRAQLTRYYDYWHINVEHRLAYSAERQTAAVG